MWILGRGKQVWDRSNWVEPFDSLHRIFPFRFHFFVCFVFLKQIILNYNDILFWNIYAVCRGHRFSHVNFCCVEFRGLIAKSYFERERTTNLYKFALGIVLENMLIWSECCFFFLSVINYCVFIGKWESCFLSLSYSFFIYGFAIDR